MAVIGINIGKSRLAEVVNTCRALKRRLENPPSVDFVFGVRLSECSMERLETVHYDWSNACDRRMFLVVGTDDVAAIKQLTNSPLAQVFDIVVVESGSDELAAAIKKTFPRAEVVISPEGTIERDDELHRLVRSGRPAIALRCHTRNGVFDADRVSKLLVAAANQEADVPEEGLVPEINEDASAPVVADAATDVAAAVGVGVGDGADGNGSDGESN